MSSENEANMNLENKPTEEPLNENNKIVNTENPLFSSLKDAENKLKNESIFLNKTKEDLLKETEAENNISKNINRLEEAEREIKESSAEFNLILTRLNYRLEEKRLANERQLQLLEEERKRSQEVIANKSILLEQLKNKKKAEEREQENEENIRLETERIRKERLSMENEEPQEPVLPVTPEEEERRMVEFKRISNVMDIVIDASVKARDLSLAYKKKLNDQKFNLDSLTTEQQEKLVRDYFTILNMNDSGVKDEILNKSAGDDPKNPNGIIFIYPSLFLSIEELNFYSRYNIGARKEAKYINSIFSLLLDENVFFIYKNHDNDKRIGYFYDGLITLMIQHDYNGIHNDPEMKENISKLIKEEIMEAIPDTMDYKLDGAIFDSDSDTYYNRKIMHRALAMRVNQKTNSILSSIKQEKRLKRSLERQPSFLVSKQTGGDCWNYSICRVIVRIICNVLDILDQNIENCNSLYEALNNFNMNIATQYCNRNSEDASDYIKILLYVFFVYLGYTNYAVCDFSESGREMKENKRLDGKNPTEVLRYFVTNVLNDKSLDQNFFTYLENLGFVSLSNIRPELKSEFANVILPLLIEFGKLTNHNCLVKRFPRVVDEKYLNFSSISKEDIVDGIETINKILDKALYIVISVFLGPNTGMYRNEFNNYKKNEEGVLPIRPYAKNVSIGVLQREEGDEKRKREIKKENAAAIGAHAMVILKYDIMDSDPGVFVYTIRNSWGSDWGDNGTIQILSTELANLHASFNWIEPSDLTVLKQGRKPQKVK